MDRRQISFLISSEFECITLRKLIFAGIKFHEFGEVWLISGKLVPARIISKPSIRKIRES